jgi:tetratricopeptide (TPR) repeat protein
MLKKSFPSLRIPFLILAAFHPLVAQAKFPKTAEEFAKLPEYCRVRMLAENTPEYDLWKKRLGAGFVHVHHYCKALNLMNYARVTTDKKDRDKMLEDSIPGGFNYMWNHAGASFVLMPEILTNKGRVLDMLGRGDEAVETYKKALDINRRYAPAYMELAELYKKHGQKDVAQRILEYAVKILPKSQLIEKRLQDIRNPAKTGSSKTGNTVVK